MHSLACCPPVALSASAFNSSRLFCAACIGADQADKASATTMNHEIRLFITIYARWQLGDAAPEIPGREIFPPMPTETTCNFPTPACKCASCRTRWREGNRCRAFPAGAWRAHPTRATPLDNPCFPTPHRPDCNKPRKSWASFAPPEAVRLPLRNTGAGATKPYPIPCGLPHPLGRLLSLAEKRRPPPDIVWNQDKDRPTAG